MWFTTLQLARALRLTSKTITTWADAGILIAEPVDQHGTAGNSGFRYSIESALSIAVARDLRARGFTVDQCGAVCEWLLEKSLDAMRAEWQAGRPLMLAIGTRVVPCFLSRAAIFNNPALNLEAAFNAGLPVAVIDVEEALRQFLAKIEAMPKSRGETCLAN